MSQTPAPGGGADVFVWVLDQLLAAMPAEAARVVRLCAVPHWLDRDLLATLLDDPAEIESALGVMRRLRIVSWETDGRFRIHDAARPYLQMQLLMGDPADWKAANAAAWSFFRARSAGADAESGAADAVEALFHQLVVDEPAALAELGRRFDEAVWNHQLGLAERFVRAAAEQAAILSPTGRQWTRYYGARLQQLYRAEDGGEAVFADLSGGAADPALVAAANLSLGRALIGRERWTEGVEHLQAAQMALDTAGDRATVPATTGAAVALAMGDAYRDLARRSGGFPPREPEPRGFWQGLRRLPFAAARGMARRWRRAPNWWWWHAGSDYQDWIIAWLLERAASWYRKAEAGAAAGDARGRADIALALAETSHQLGHWADARQRFELLLANDVVQASPYGTARAKLGRGAVAVAAGEAGDGDRGHVDLAEALAVFRRFADPAGVGAVATVQGRAALAAGRAEEAVAAFSEAVQALGSARDPLAQTEVGATLAELAARADLPEASRDAARTAAESITEHHYLARFPGSLLGRFRKLAIYVALPITFVLGSLLGIVVVILVGFVVESEWLLLSMGRSDALRPVDHLTLLAFALVLALIALWLYPFVYGLLGMLLVRSLGRGLLGIEQEQPEVVATTLQSICLYDRAHADGLDLPWPAVTGAEAADLRLWKKPVQLISRTALRQADGPPLVVEAITAGYPALQQDIEHGLREPVQLRRWDLSLLSPGWVLGVFAVAGTLVAAAGALGGVLEQTTEVEGAIPAIELTLLLTPSLAMLVPTFVLLFTTVTHWRLVRHARRVSRAAGIQLSVIPLRLLVFAALAWTVLTALWLAWLLMPADGS
jgi:tetratricopeptide (TPR) repeat protein